MKNIKNYEIPKVYTVYLSRSFEELGEQKQGVGKRK